MEAKELMVGDKVLVKVLSQIPETYVPHTWCEEDYTRNLQVKPIPLTAERLEKNGAICNYGIWFFEKNVFERASFWYCYGNEDHMSDEANEYFGGHWVFDDNYRIDYFHELQRALRLCGLNEIANNLTI